jgi:hypothetical protein
MLLVLRPIAWVPVKALDDLLEAYVAGVKHGWLKVAVLHVHHVLMCYVHQLTTTPCTQVVCLSCTPVACSWHGGCVPCQLLSEAALGLWDSGQQASA